MGRHAAPPRQGRLRQLVRACRPRRATRDVDTPAVSDARLHPLPAAPPAADHRVAGALHPPAVVAAGPPAPAAALPYAPPAAEPAVAGVQRALDGLHARHIHLPRADLTWQVHPDRVVGEVHPLAAASDRDAVVAMYAAALGSTVRRRLRDPATDGVQVVSTSGMWGPVSVTVGAVVCPDVPGPMRVYEQAACDPSLDDPATEVFTALVDESGQHRLGGAR